MTAISHETTCYFCGPYSPPNDVGLQLEAGFTWEPFYWKDGSGQTVRCRWCMSRDEKAAILLLAGWKHMDQSDTWMSPVDQPMVLYARYYSLDTAFAAALHVVKYSCYPGGEKP